MWLTRELLESPAWRALSINSRRLIDELLLEHMGHAGRENGKLARTHEQLREAGLTSTCIREAVEEAEFLGILNSERGGRWAGSNMPSRYRLTFYADKDGSPPTNEWRGITQEKIDAWRADRATIRSAKRKRKAALESQRMVRRETSV